MCENTKKSATSDFTFDPDFVLKYQVGLIIDLPLPDLYKDCYDLKVQLWIIQL